MTDYTWLLRLHGLLERFPQYGIGADMAAMSIAELWGVYCFLQRLADGA